MLVSMMTWYKDRDHRLRALPFFSGANFVEREAIDIGIAQGEEKHPKD